MSIPSETAPLAKGDGAFASLFAGTRSQSWLASFLFHVALFLILAIVLGTVRVVEHFSQAPTFTAEAEPPTEKSELQELVIERRHPDITELDVESLQQAASQGGSVEVVSNAGEFDGEPLGGSALGSPVEILPREGIDLPTFGRGPKSKGIPGHDPQPRKGPRGNDDSLVNRLNRKAFLDGRTRATEQAVTGGLQWIARHQNADGSWSMNHTGCCRNGRCSGPGDSVSDAAATALGLLPFLAAGQTHEVKGMYRQHVRRGLEWLVAHQKPNGDLSAGGSQMYSHGLATIALCEAYGMTGDSRIGYAAQLALQFIMAGQNQEGGWRYTHGSQDSDLSVVGWQVMALKSGQMAGLKVDPQNMDRARKYLGLSASGSYQDRFAYTPKGSATLPMTSVGLLLSQYLGATRDSPVVTGGVEYLSQNLPSLERRNIYAWYYATQAMHNVPGPTWDTWNRAMRRILIDSQEKAGCVAGSWDPEKPTSDAWGKQGGRLMVTSLSCLTLEVYYRFLPLYQLDGKKK